MSRMACVTILQTQLGNFILVKCDLVPLQSFISIYEYLRTPFFNFYLLNFDICFTPTSL